MLKNNLLVEAQYSRAPVRVQRRRRHRAPASSIRRSSTASCSCIYNAPYFDATDPEQRNNRQLTGSVTNFWNWRGRHETKGGYEWFRSQRTGGNSQSSTSYVFDADFVDRRERQAGARFDAAG